MNAQTVVIHCNAGGEHGMGHLMRAIAVAEEADRRGWAVRIAGHFTTTATKVISTAVPAARLTAFSQIASSETWSRYLRRVEPAVLHVDTYVGVDESWRRGPWLHSNVQDGEFGCRPADITIDPNLDAEAPPDAPSRTSQLFGIDYSLIRQQVRERRIRPHTRTDFQKILVVMGGTDPTAITPLVVSYLSHIPGQRQFTVITPQGMEDATREASRMSSHEFTLIPFAEDLPGLSASHDLVLSAAGTSVWDLACLGIPMALVCVVDNQEKGYRAAVRHDIAFPVGRTSGSALEHGIMSLGETLRTAPNDLEAKARTAFDLVDGEGASRVVDEWSRRLAIPL